MPIHVFRYQTWLDFTDNKRLIVSSLFTFSLKHLLLCYMTILTAYVHLYLKTIDCRSVCVSGYAFRVLPDTELNLGTVVGDGSPRFMGNFSKWSHLFVCLFLLYTGSIFRGKCKYPSVPPYGHKIQNQNYITNKLKH